jgi:MFS family permease
MCGALVSLGPLAVVRAGFGEAAVAAFMAGVWGGGLVVQMPVGRASDRWGRRPVLAAAGALSALGVTALGIVLATGADRVAPIALGLLVAAAAGLAFVFYPLGAAYTLDRVPAEVAAGANRALLLAYAIGSSTGPLVASALMDGFGANALFAFLACVAMTTSVFTLFRLRRFALLPQALRSRVLLVPRTSSVATAMDPRTMTERHRAEEP